MTILASFASYCPLEEIVAAAHWLFDMSHYCGDIVPCYCQTNSHHLENLSFGVRCRHTSWVSGHSHCLGTGFNYGYGYGLSECRDTRRTHSIIFYHGLPKLHTSLILLSDKLTTFYMLIMFRIVRGRGRIRLWAWKYRRLSAKVYAMNHYSSCKVDTYSWVVSASTPISLPRFWKSFAFNDCTPLVHTIAFHFSSICSVSVLSLDLTFQPSCWILWGFHSLSITDSSSLLL